MAEPPNNTSLGMLLRSQPEFSQKCMFPRACFAASAEPLELHSILHDNRPCLSATNCLSLPHISTLQHPCSPPLCGHRRNESSPVIHMHSIRFSLSHGSIGVNCLHEYKHDSFRTEYPRDKYALPSCVTCPKATAMNPDVSRFVRLNRQEYKDIVTIGAGKFATVHRYSTSSSLFFASTF